MYRFTLIWTDGEKQECTFIKKEHAYRAQANNSKAFGNQIQFSCVTPITTWSKEDEKNAEDYGWRD